MKKRKEIRKGKYKLQAFRSSAGLGLKTLERIPDGRFVAEYTGYELTSDEAEKKGGRYLFEISSRRVIDGSPKWNIARYINHSCRPNCEAVNSKGRIYIYAIKNIKEGSEITYSYGRVYFNDFIKKGGCKCQYHLKNRGGR
ncbi:MAG: SET domain-containing protein [Candidatus Campbellbacteria bacterium]|nr:SET domain-containing protein [Candidatus Campbellbacteria bacterium]